MKKLLFAVLAVFFVFSCKMPNNSSARSSAITKAYIDKKYPHFSVYVDNFYLHNSAKDLKIMPEEKEYILELLAEMRFVVNTPEFEQDAMTPIFGFENILPWNTRSCPSGKGEYNIGWNQTRLKRERIIQSIQGASYKVNYYKKVNGGGDTLYADLGPLSYVCVGHNDFEYGKNIYLHQHNWLPNKGGWPRDSFIKGVFHEHMHNLGYAHENQPEGAGVPNIMAMHFMNAYNKVINDSKYAADLKELKDFYKKYHAGLTAGDTVTVN